MSEPPPRPDPTTVPSGRATQGNRLRVASVDSENERAHAASSRSGRKARCAAASSANTASAFVDRLDQWVRSERPHGIGPRSRPRGLRCEHLVLGQHLDEAAEMTWQLALRKRLDPGGRAAARHLYHEVVGEARQRAAVRDVHGQHVARVVEDGVHRVDRELELVDAAAGPSRIEDRIVASPPARRSAPSTPAPTRGCPRPASSASPAARRAPRRASSSTGSSRPGSRPSPPRAAGCAARAARAANRGRGAPPRPHGRTGIRSSPS